ncbi:hypothetical protein EJB05_53164, partial [Eragrostis curvula]
MMETRETFHTAENQVSEKPKEDLEKDESSHAKSCAGETGCFKCGNKGHAAQACPNPMRCDKCGAFGHAGEQCKSRKLWEYVAPMCATQVEGQGFFCIPDCPSDINLKERSITALITVVSGSVTSREIETEFKELLGSNAWRWIARMVEDNKFTVRFPTAQMIKDWGRFRPLGMRSVHAQIAIDPWNASVGAKFEMQQAWFRVRGIPYDKRSKKTLAYVGSLVGATTAVDEKSLYRQDYVRIKICCKDVTKVPATAEGAIIPYMYEFSFKREVTIPTTNPNEPLRIQDKNDKDSQPNSKKPRMGDPENSNKGTGPSLGHSGGNYSAPAKCYGSGKGDSQRTLQIIPINQTEIVTVEDGEESVIDEVPFKITEAQLLKTTRKSGRIQAQILEKMANKQGAPTKKRSLEGIRVNSKILDPLLIPEKVKIFLWLIENGAILTKDNMIKRKWQGDPTCYFCQQPETIDHLLFSCCVAKVVWGIIAHCFGADTRPSSMVQHKDWIKMVLPGGDKVYTEGLAAVCWAIWKSRNKACFDKIMIKHPCDIVFYICSFLRYWAGLYSAEMNEVIQAGAKTMMKMVINILSRQGRCMLTNARQDGGGQADDAAEEETDNVRTSTCMATSTPPRAVATCVARVAPADLQDLRVFDAKSIDVAVDRILEELKEDAAGLPRSSGRHNVIYFDGWDGLGASAVLRAQGRSYGVGRVGRGPPPVSAAKCPPPAAQPDSRSRSGQRPCFPERASSARLIEPANRAKKLGKQEFIIFAFGSLNQGRAAHNSSGELEILDHQFPPPMKEVTKVHLLTVDGENMMVHYFISVGSKKKKKFDRPTLTLKPGSATVRAVGWRLTPAALAGRRALAAAAGLEFSHIFHIDCSKWKSRRAMQRMIAEQLKLPDSVIQVLDVQDEEDDYQGVGKGSRAEIPQVSGAIYEQVQKLVMNRRFVVIFHNGSNEEIDLDSFGFPLSGSDIGEDKMMSDILHHEAEEIAREMVNINTGGINWHAVATNCFLYVMKLRSMGSQIIDYDMSAHACKYWRCDGIIQALQPGDISTNDGVDKLWLASDAMHREIRLDDDYYQNPNLPSPEERHLQKRMSCWTSPTYGFMLIPDPHGQIPIGMFLQFNQLRVLKLSNCKFSFTSPPFIWCHNLRFLWLDRCRERSSTTVVRKEYLHMFLQRLWVLDVRYSNKAFLSKEMMDFMTQLRELNVVGEDKQLHFDFMNKVRRLRVKEFTGPYFKLSRVGKMELFGMSGDFCQPTSLNIDSNNLETVIIDGSSNLTGISLTKCAKMKNIF